MEHKKKIEFIINPNSGLIKVVPIKTAIEHLIDANLFDFSFTYTTHRGHAVELAEQFASTNTDIVVAVGGDGTVNEVGRGLIGSNTAMGIIPCGSGNGLARHIGIPMDLINSIKWLNKHKIINIDYGTINSNPFFCTCGLGFDADVSKRFADSKIRGVVTYVEKILQEALVHKEESITIITDGEEENIEAYIVTFANAGQWGNNIYIAPLASLTDGLLDVTILTPFTPMDVPTLAYHLFNKQIDKNRKIRTFKTRSLTIKREKDGVVHIDGEPIQLGNVLNIEIIKDGLKIAIPTKKLKI